ncbi:MAG: hypothetical protein J5U19_09000 [Candidatus Methanoperedens sp.]|nr:hypothetical protein [Candidatus Methanoperedens sp.]
MEAIEYIMYFSDKFAQERHDARSHRGQQSPSGSRGADGILSHRSGKIYKYRSALLEKGGWL